MRRDTLLLEQCLAGLGLVLMLFLGGCGGDDDKDPGPRSPVSDEARGVSDANALAPLPVSAVEPAVPFRASTIKRGDTIGLVGNSGNTSAPHLHFHVMDGPSPLTSEGVPYVIDSFATRGRLRSTAVFDRYESTTTPFAIMPFAGDARNRDQMPLDLTVVDFG